MKLSYDTARCTGQDGFPCALREGCARYKCEGREEYQAYITFAVRSNQACPQRIEFKSTEGAPNA